MWNSRAPSHLLTLLLLHSVLALVSAQGSTRNTWSTLSGDAPLVVARGGFSGLFPDSSLAAYNLALLTSVGNVISWCDVQLTKDQAGICLPDVKLDNATDINLIFQKQSTSYLVNGVLTRGYFSVDYTLEDLSQVTLSQGVYSRTNKFDGNLFPIFTVEDLVKQVRPPALWLNIQHDAFFRQHNLSMRAFVLSVSKKVVVNYISSTEVSFLRSIAARINPNITKMVFRFMEKADIEPSTNQTYGSLLNNLTFIKTFASGIMVPKGYIWPVYNVYLQPHTTLVSDAHKEGLEVFASDFVNDVPISYNYSYDPLAEYLQFIDNGDFSVDGVLSDFPITPSEAVDCFAHLGPNARKRDNTLVISKFGASGDYPPCTDLAYNKAIADGVDVLDCPVQLSKDGKPFCLSSIDLIESSTVAQSNYSILAVSIPAIKPSGSGIFSFKLTEDQIKTLTPSILNPYTKYALYRNPNNKKAGNFLTLSDFLSLAKNKTSLSGVMITVENAAYLAEHVGLSVTDVVLNALTDANYDKKGAPKVMIQSTNSSVLKEFKDKPNYELVYKIDNNVGDAVNAAVEEIKGFADSVVVEKSSVFPLNSAFVTGSTNIVLKLQSFNLSVYVETFDNEFVSQAWDFFSDATVEINSFVQGAGINGVITGFPKTADRYRRNRCLSGKNPPAYMEPVKPGSLLQLVTKEYLPPAEAPLPPLIESEVSEPPLPPVSNQTGEAPGPATGAGAGAGPGPSPPGNAQPKVTICFLSPLAVFVSFLLLL